MPALPGQLAALASLDQAKPVQELAAENGSPYPSMQKAINSLEAAGLVTTIRCGRERVVTAASPAIASLARALIFDAPRQDWRAVFHGDRLVMLHVLDRVRNPTLAAEVCGLSRSAVYHAIQIHAPAGILVRAPGGYRVNTRLMEFRAFLLEWNSLRSTQAIRALDAQATSMWRLGPELMFRSRKTIPGPGVHLGAYSAMAAQGAPVIERTDVMTYYVTKRRLSPADAVLQAMVQEGNDMASTGLPPPATTRAQWAAFVETSPAADLSQKARIYNKVEEVQGILAYLANRKAPGFLPWPEYERFRQQYGATP